MELVKNIITIWIMFICLMSIVLILAEVSADNREEAEAETYRCDGLQNGTIVEGDTYFALFTTGYQVAICDETSIRDDGESWITVSPNTYSDYEQGKINKLENWEA